MAILSLDALSVASFQTTTATDYGTITVRETDNCGSPLCVTDDPVCTTPWCPPTPPQPVDTVAG
jgi:hypothetical protein